MHVWVDPARKHEQPLRVDHPGRLGTERARGVDGGDLLAGDRDVGLPRALLGDDGAVDDENVVHASYLRRDAGRPRAELREHLVGRRDATEQPAELLERPVVVVGPVLGDRVLDDDGHVAAIGGVARGEIDALARRDAGMDEGPNAEVAQERIDVRGREGARRQLRQHRLAGERRELVEELELALALDVSEGGLELLHVRDQVAAALHLRRRAGRRSGSGRAPGSTRAAVAMFGTRSSSIRS